MATRSRRSAGGDAPTLNPTMIQLLDMRRLKQELDLRGLPTTGSKQLLADRLSDAVETTHEAVVCSEPKKESVKRPVRRKSALVKVEEPDGDEPQSSSVPPSKSILIPKTEVFDVPSTTVVPEKPKTPRSTTTKSPKVQVKLPVKREPVETIEDHTTTSTTTNATNEVLEQPSKLSPAKSSKRTTKAKAQRPPPSKRQKLIKQEVVSQSESDEDVPLLSLLSNNGQQVQAPTVSDVQSGADAAAAPDAAPAASIADGDSDDDMPLLSKLPPRPPTEKNSRPEISVIAHKHGTRSKARAVAVNLNDDVKPLIAKRIEHDTRLLSGDDFAAEGSPEPPRNNSEPVQLAKGDTDWNPDITTKPAAKEKRLSVSEKDRSVNVPERRPSIVSNDKSVAAVRVRAPERKTITDVWAAKMAEMKKSKQSEQHSPSPAASTDVKPSVLISVRTENLDSTDKALRSPVSRTEERRGSLIGRSTISKPVNSVASSGTRDDLLGSIMGDQSQLLRDRKRKQEETDRERELLAEKRKNATRMSSGLQTTTRVPKAVQSSSNSLASSPLAPPPPPPKKLSSSNQLPPPPPPKKKPSPRFEIADFDISSTSGPQKSPLPPNRLVPPPPPPKPRNSSVTPRLVPPPPPPNKPERLRRMNDTPSNPESSSASKSASNSGTPRMEVSTSCSAAPVVVKKEVVVKQEAPVEKTGNELVDSVTQALLKIIEQRRMQVCEVEEDDDVVRECLSDVISSLEDRQRKDLAKKRISFDMKPSTSKDAEYHIHECMEEEYDPFETSAVDAFEEYVPSAVCTRNQTLEEGQLGTEYGDSAYDLEQYDGGSEDDGADDDSDDDNEMCSSSRDIDKSVKRAAAGAHVDELMRNPRDLLLRASAVLESFTKPSKETEEEEAEDNGPLYSQMPLAEDFEYEPEESEKPAPDYHGEPVPSDDDDMLFQIAAGIAKPKKKKEIVIEEEKLPSDETIEPDYYNADLHIKGSSKTSWLIEPENADGLALMWGGVRSNYGIRLPFRDVCNIDSEDKEEEEEDEDPGYEIGKSGKVVFQIKIVEFLSTKHLPFEEMDPHDVRVGFSLRTAPNILGEYMSSYCITSLGKKACNNEFVDFGQPFHQNDIVTACIDFDQHTISYWKNLEYLGVAFRDIRLPDGDAVFPHICIKNCSVAVNFGDFPGGESEWLTDPQWRFQSALGRGDLERSPKAPESKSDCTVLMMVGLPGVGKTTWVRQYLRDHPSEQWTVIQSEGVMAAMKINGVSRKRSHHGRWDMVMGMVGKSLQRSILLAARRRRNYIIDMTNASRDVRKKRLQLFEEFRRKCVVIIPSDDDMMDRQLRQSRQEGTGGMPPEAMLEMKAIISIPAPEHEPLEDVYFIEPPLHRIQDAIDIVARYNEEGRPWYTKKYRRRRSQNVGLGPDRDRDDRKRYSAPLTVLPPLRVSITSVADSTGSPNGNPLSTSANASSSTTPLQIQAFDFAVPPPRIPVSTSIPTADPIQSTSTASFPITSPVVSSVSAAPMSVDMSVPPPSNLGSSPAVICADVSVPPPSSASKSMALLPNLSCPPPTVPPTTPITPILTPDFSVPPPLERRPSAPVITNIMSASDSLPRSSSSVELNTSLPPPSIPTAGQFSVPPPSTPTSTISSTLPPAPLVRVSIEELPQASAVPAALRFRPPPIPPKFTDLEIQLDEEEIREVRESTKASSSNPMVAEAVMRAKLTALQMKKKEKLMASRVSAATPVLLVSLPQQPPTQPVQVAASSTVVKPAVVVAPQQSVPTVPVSTTTPTTEMAMAIPTLGQPTPTVLARPRAPQPLMDVKPIPSLNSRAIPTIGSGSTPISIDTSSIVQNRRNTASPSSNQNSPHMSGSRPLSRTGNSSGFNVIQTVSVSPVAALSPSVVGASFQQSRPMSPSPMQFMPRMEQPSQFSGFSVPPPVFNMPPPTMAMNVNPSLSDLSTFNNGRMMPSPSSQEGGYWTQQRKSSG